MDCLNKIVGVERAGLIMTVLTTLGGLKDYRTYKCGSVRFILNDDRVVVVRKRNERNGYYFDDKVDIAFIYSDRFKSLGRGLWVAARLGGTLPSYTPLEMYRAGVPEMVIDYVMGRKHNLPKAQLKHKNSETAISSMKNVVPMEKKEQTTKDHEFIRIPAEATIGDKKFPIFLQIPEELLIYYKIRKAAKIAM